MFYSQDELCRGSRNSSQNSEHNKTGAVSMKHLEAKVHFPLLIVALLWCECTKMKILLWLAIIEIIVQSANCSEDLHRDALILQKCLGESSELAEGGSIDLEKLRSYADWTKEEIPCLTRCMAHARGWFDIQHAKWHKQQIVDDLGADTYNYCRFELNRPVVNACEFAHKGLRCLKKAELHSLQSKTAMLQCINELGVSSEQLERYQLLPIEHEEVPCLFKCLADKMKLYTSDYKNWHHKNWVDAFGPPKLEDPNAHEICRASEEFKKRAHTICYWMYREFLCLEHLNAYFKVENAIA